ncbi:MAG: hypothetical protein AAFQ80_06370 [Cyanobacteria bacterium J06621_8]
MSKLLNPKGGSLRCGDCRRLEQTEERPRVPFILEWGQGHNIAVRRKGMLSDVEPAGLRANNF